MEEIIFIDEGL
jgi:hypothetical protein